jgi:hypothetical protein
LNDTLLAHGQSTWQKSELAAERAAKMTGKTPVISSSE